MYHYVECGLSNVWLSNGYQKEETTYGEVVSIHDVSGLHKAIGMNMIKTRSSLNADEVRFLRTEMDLSQVQLAQMLDVAESTVRNWESARVSCIPGPSDRLLRLLYAEFVEEGTEIRRLIEEISRLNRQVYGSRTYFGEDGGQWHTRAA